METLRNKIRILDSEMAWSGNYQWGTQVLCHYANSLIDVKPCKQVARLCGVLESSEIDDPYEFATLRDMCYKLIDKKKPQIVKRGDKHRIEYVVRGPMYNHW